MRTILSITLALFTSTLVAGCVASPDDPADPGDEQVAEVQSAEVVAVPFCADVHKNLMYPHACWLPNGHDGIQTCTDHITFHYVPVFGGGFPPPPPTCKLTGTDVWTSCGPCVDIELPLP
jgi:hypothetical protein